MTAYNLIKITKLVPYLLHSFYSDVEPVQDRSAAIFLQHIDIIQPTSHYN